MYFPCYLMEMVCAYALQFHSHRINNFQRLTLKANMETCP